MIYDAEFILSCYPDIYTKDDLKIFVKVGAITKDQYKITTGGDYETQSTIDNPVNVTVDITNDSIEVTSK